MRPTSLLCAAVLSLAACAQPTVRPVAPAEDEVEDGFMATDPELANQQPVPPGPVLLNQDGPPPAYDRTVTQEILTVLDTTAEAGGVFDFIGVYHGDQAPASDGERWLALDSAGGAWTLTPVTVRAQTARDEIVDDADGPFTGVAVRTERSTRLYDAWHDPASLFFRSDRLTAGPVETAFSGLWGMEPDTELTVELGGRAWALESAAVEGRPYQAVLLLDGTPVVYLPNRDGGNRTLHWAGDLDRDGALDLVVNVSDHYNASELQLWLSSAADAGAPLGLAASHYGTGC